MAKAKKKSTKQKADSTKDKLVLALDVSKIVELMAVRLIGSSFSSKPSALEGLKEVDIDVNIQCRTQEDEHILVFPRFLLKAKQKGKKEAEENIQVRIEAEYILIYEAKDLKNLSDESILAFANTNGIFNAWPYWREYVQSTIARLGIPNYTVPVFRLGAEEGPKKGKPKKRISKKVVPVETH